MSAFKEQGVLRRKEIMVFLESYIENHGYSPTVREIGQAVGLKSSSPVHSHLYILNELGYITWNPNIPRTIRIINKEGNK